MPIYEYACEQCHETEEVLQKIDDDAPEICSHCRAKNTLKKTITMGSFHLKGGGWYKDLYSSNKPESSSSSEKKKSSDKE